MRGRSKRGKNSLKIDKIRGFISLGIWSEIGSMLETETEEKINSMKDGKEKEKRWERESERKRNKQKEMRLRCK